MKIFEGLVKGDLDGLVLPVVSIDEYESKLDSSFIVVGFYVTEKDAANDLNRFIQKSTVDLMDTEISPASDEDGFYLVFVEFERNEDFPYNITQLLEQIENLVGIDEWQAIYYGFEKHYDLNEKTILDHVKL